MPTMLLATLNNKVFIWWCSCLLIIIGYANHELWRDEIYTLQLCKATSTFKAFMQIKQYVGHPTLYYIIFFLTSKVSTNLLLYKCVHGSVTLLSMYIVICKLPTTVLQSYLLCCSYYFLFEYGILCRSYAFVVLFCTLFLWLYNVWLSNKKSKYLICSIIALALAANMQVQAIIITIGLGGTALLMQVKTVNKSSFIFCAFILVIGVYISYHTAKVPIDGEYNLGTYWPSKVSFIAVLQKMNIGFLPIGNYSKINFWNNFIFYKTIVHIALFLLIIAASFLSLSIKVRWYYLATLLVSIYLLALLGSWGFRHFGFVFMVYFLFYFLTKINRLPTNTTFINLLLAIHAIGGLGAIYKDFKYPFSNSIQVAQFINSLPQNSAIAGMQGYTLDPICYYTNRKLYYFGVGKVQDITTYKSPSFIPQTDTITFIKQLTVFLKDSTTAYIIFSADKYKHTFVNNLFSNSNITASKVFSTTNNSIVTDEDYEIYSVKRKSN